MDEQRAPIEASEAEPVTLRSGRHDQRQLHPLHGPRRSVGRTPRRRPGVVRRTSSVDTLRPQGLSGPTIQRGRARDLLTDADGASIVGEARIEITLEYDGGPRIASASAEPAPPGLERIVGLKASTVFRQHAAELIDLDRGLPLFALIDEIPAATLVSGHAIAHAQLRGDLEFTPEQCGPRLQNVDLCAGFVAEGAIMTNTDEDGRGPVVTGPEAPLVIDEGDPLGWHELDGLRPDAMRRLRRLDLWRGGEDLLEIDVFFRDSHQIPPGHRAGDPRVWPPGSRRPDDVALHRGEGLRPLAALAGVPSGCRQR